MQFNIGKIEAQKHTVLHNLSMTQDRIGLFQDTLMKEYGTFDVNIDDGKINWPKENKDEKWIMNSTCAIIKKEVAKRTKTEEEKYQRRPHPILRREHP